MEIKVIDLYSEFGIVKQNNADGRLKIMLPDRVVSGKQRPAILIIAGGGYDHVSPREQEPVATKYLASGYNCFILHYSTKVLYPTAMIEGALAMLYIRKNATILGVDSDKIFAMGFSAGAHLAGCLALNLDEQIFLDSIKDIPALLDASDKNTLRPKGLLLCYPVITTDKRYCHQGSIDNLSGGDNRLIGALSLEKRVKKDMPSVFIWHTFDDNSVPVYNSLCFATALMEKGVKCSLHIFESGKHGLSVATNEVYKDGEMPRFSTGLEGWVKLSLDWLSDQF